MSTTGQGLQTGRGSPPSVVTTTELYTTLPGGTVVATYAVITSTISPTASTDTGLQSGLQTGATERSGVASTSSSTRVSTPAQHTTTGRAHNPTSPTPAPSEKATGLSTGAAIGIGIAIAVFVIGLLCAFGFFWFRRHSRRKQGEANPVAHQAWETKRSEGGGSEREKVQGSEIENIVSSPYELSGRSRAGELETSANRHELDAYRRGESEQKLPQDHVDSEQYAFRYS